MALAPFIRLIPPTRTARSVLLSRLSPYSYYPKTVSECFGVSWTVDSRLLQPTPRAVWSGMLLIVHDLIIHSIHSTLLDLSVAVLAKFFDSLVLYALDQEFEGLLSRGGTCRAM